MNSQKLKEAVSNLPDSRLAMFVVCCHVDKLLTESIPSSKYDIFIQAGAALTDKRVCEINDLDDVEDSVSDRNQRYSEMSAMYWAGKNIETEYVGISHYRRRFVLTDQQLSDYLDKGFDIITTKRCTIEDNVKDNYIAAYYQTDWQLFMDILGEYAPDYMELAESEFALNTLHPCNMNIFTASMYKEYCDWIFPMLDAFHKRSPWKLDLYQRRDVGFIGERLSSLFVEMKREQGANIIEVPFKDFRSNEWIPENECDLSDYNAVLEACRKYYLKSDISKCRRLVAGAISNGGTSNSTIVNLARLFKTAIDEQKCIPETMYEYLPEKWMCDLDTLLATYNGLGNIVSSLGQQIIDAIANSNSNDGNICIDDQIVGMFNEFINATGFSSIAVRSQCLNQGIKDEAIINGIIGLMG